MNWNDFLNNAVQAQRAAQMKTSEQLMLGEIILKLEAVEDKHKPVIFNEQYHPTDIISWRGSYSELSLEYAEKGRKCSVEAWISRLRGTVGAIRYGYKGGEFLMGKTTPVWVANYGESAGFIGATQAVVDIAEHEHAVMVETKPLEY